MSVTFLVDGSSIFFRSFHAIRDLRRSDGMATNAVYGYVMTLRSLIREYQPEQMAVAFDAPGKTFRSEIDEQYKANRVKPPDDLVVQIPSIKKVTTLLGISHFEAAGFEADDLIGAMAVWLSEQGQESILVSGDKDFFQLVNDRISVLRLTPKRNDLYKPSDVQKRYGVTPEQFVDVLALMGDSVDNVPGAPGIGEKTAIALIQEYGSIDNLYDRVDTVKGKKRKDNLIEFKEQVYRSRRLVTIKTDVDLGLTSIEQFKIAEPNTENLLAFYQDFEFRTLASELDTAPDVVEERDYQTVDSLDALTEIAERIRECGFCAVDTETTSLNPLQARLVGISFSIEEKQGWYIPIGHVEGKNLPLDQARPVLKEILESDAIAKTGHHLKYDLHVLENEGFHLQGIQDDTLISSYLIEPDLSSHKLDDLVWRQFGMKMTPISDLIGTGKNQKCMADIDIPRVSDYACEDTDAAWRLCKALRPKLDDYGLRRLYEEVEMPLLQVLAAMERRGIKVDPDVLAKQSVELGKEMDSIADDIFQSVGKEFNLNSPLQLAKILYDDLELLSGRTRSTRADILEKLAGEGVVIARWILDYRHRKKIKSTYLDALRMLMNPDTGRIHTTYNQAVVNTGRISSSDPNLQNIPIRTDLGRRVRRAFVAEDGYLLVSLDYSQIELRILAHISQDPGLLSAFAQGDDIHRRTAAEIFDVSIDEVQLDMRRKAKEINFGLNYGMSPYGLARRLQIHDHEAAAYIEKYFKRYPRVQAYMDETTDAARERLYVTTILGRRIPTPGVRDSNRNRQENALRAAINAPIQGSAADLMKIAMIQVHQALKDQPDRASILLTVHDELVLEVREDCVEEIADLCRDLMDHAMKLDIPIPVECSTGSNWADLK